MLHEPGVTPPPPTPRMGQAAFRPSPGAVFGEVEVGQEALFLLQSREEYSSVIVGMMPAPYALTRKTRENITLRITNRSGSTWSEEMGDYHPSLSETDDSQGIASGHTLQERRDTAEEQLVDVFYSTFHHVSEATGGGASPEEGGGGGATGGLDSGAEDTQSSGINIEELRKELRDIFKVDDDTMLRVEEEVRAKEPPQNMVHITIHEAKDLRPKTSRDTSHPYCIVKVSGCSEIFKTKVLSDTLTPSWELQFSIGIPTLCDAKLMVEVWHKPQEVAVEQLGGVKNFQALSRLVRDAATSFQMKGTRNLLGSVNVPLAEMKNQNIEGWYDLVKIKEEEVNQIPLRENFKPSKKRGSIRIGQRVSSFAQLNLIGPHWFDAFLNKVVQHHLGYLSNYGNFSRGSKRWSKRSRSSTRCITDNGTSSSWNSNVNAIINKDNSKGTTSIGSSIENETVWNLSMPWKGTLSNTSQAVLSHYAATLSLTTPFTTLSWWKVSSKFSVTDQSFLGHLLKAFQGFIGKNCYSEEEIQEIRSSLKTWTSVQLDRIRKLTFHFPSSTKFVSYNQLKGMLSNFYFIETDLQILQPKIFPKDVSVTELVSEALMDFTKSWWESSLKNHGGTSPSASDNQQLETAVSVAGEVFSFLSDVCSFYHDVFFREARISYLRLTYILLTSELAAQVRPLLLKIYRVPTKQKYSHAISAAKHSEADQLSLEAGAPDWQLYKKLEIIQKIGENLPDEVQTQSGIRGYHHWFFGGVIRWQERLFARARVIVTKEVRRDEFEMDSSGISSSASGAKANMIIIRNSWQKLAWPDEIDGDMAKRLLQDLCGLGTLYTKLVITKLDLRLREESLPEFTFLTLQTCTGLNNIEYLQQEVEGLLELFELTDDDAELRFLIAKTSSKMEGSLLLFMDNVIRKIKPTLWKAVVNSCDTGNEAHLLQEILDQDICILKQKLRDKNFQHLLLKIWNVLIVIFRDIVEGYLTKQNAEYFKNVYKVLERTWCFFTPCDRRGLDPQQAHSVEYQSLKKNLCNLKMPTESLIAKYYKERYEELQRANILCSAEIVVRIFFMRNGKLIVQVVMVRDIVKRSKKKPNTRVQIKLVPSEWFPGVCSQETRTQRASDAPVFDQNFEFSVSRTDFGVQDGHLLMILKTCHRFHSDDVIGETVMPLEEVPLVESSTDSTIIYKVLKMNIPCDGDDYTAIKALKFRTWEKSAQTFLQ